nr:decaprenyl-phosphate phosphoribosyltransferase [Methanohalobium evestigatum]
MRSLRPSQWYKNFIIFLALIFSHNLMNPMAWMDSITAFVIFCMLSGSLYLMNDIMDAEDDKKHPVKCKRPIASGELKKSHAFFIFIVLLSGSLYISSIVNYAFLLISVLYFVLLFAYNLKLKYIVLVDVLTISAGFVLRAIAGAVALTVSISPWLIICTFLLALFLAFGKRRHELVLLGDDAKNHRKILDEYTVPLLEQMTLIVTSALIVSYLLYTFFASTHYMMVTIPFLVYGLFRYLLLVHSQDFGGEPEMLFKDKGMLFSISIWAILVAVVLYFVPDGSTNLIYILNNVGI